MRYYINKYFNFFFSSLLIFYLSTFLIWYTAFSYSDSEIILDIKNVCFGVSKNGNPSFFGWINLLFSPLCFFVFLFIVFKNEIYIFLNSNKNIVEKILFFSFLIFNLIAFFNVGNKVIKNYKNSFIYKNKKKTDFNLSNYPVLNLEIPNFKLLNYDGKIIDNSIFIDKISFLTFVFSKCTTICPKIINMLKELNKNINNHKNINIIFITLDPWRDNLTNIFSFSKKLNFFPNEYFLTSSVNDINFLLDKFDIPISRNEIDGDIVHPGLVYVVDKNCNIKYVFNSPSYEWLIETYKNIEKIN